MDDGKILFALIDSFCVIRLHGVIAYKLSPDFETFLQRISYNTRVESFIIDLTETEYIDSTNLGLIARIFELSHSRHQAVPRLISNKDSINEVLRNVGFDKVFEIVESFELLQIQMREIPVNSIHQKELAATMLSAHKALASINQSNSEKFHDVITYLEHDLT
ncbi:MAG: STAS domain-containing protein [Chitinivibrionales bacterium]|nr:STAS domain-containing protein [Chitinivibrionales bacterium]